MRLLIVILVLVGVAFAAVIAFGSLRSPDSGNPPPSDQEALEEKGWEPPDWAAAMNAVMSPFAPGLEMTPARVSVNAGAEVERRAPAADEDLRMARLALTSGRGIAVEYGCRDGEGRSCPQKACLCPSGATFTDAEIGDLCTDGWEKRRRTGGGVRCRAEDSEATIVIYPEGGKLVFRPLGTGAATAEFR